MCYTVHSFKTPILKGNRMFKLDYITSNYGNNILYSSKACFGKDSNAEKLCLDEFVNIINTEWDCNFKSVDEILSPTGFALFDNLISTLDNLSYGITGMICGHVWH